MTPTLLSLALLVGISAYLMANEWAKDDNAEANRKNDKGDTSGLQHEKLLAWRISELCVGLGIPMGILLRLDWNPDHIIQGYTMWHLLPLAGMAWSIFGSAHVWKLNKLRGMDWRYLAPGNVWDWWWMRTTLKYRNDTRAANIITHKSNYESNFYQYANLVHKAGTRAMVFRGLVFAASVVTYTLLICL